MYLLDSPLNHEKNVFTCMLFSWLHLIIVSWELLIFHSNMRACILKNKKNSLIMALADHFSDFKDQMYLYLAGNNQLLTDKRIEDADCESIYKTLQTNSYVTSLDLRYNIITDEGVKFLAQLLEVWKWNITSQYRNLFALSSFPIAPWYKYMPHACVKLPFYHLWNKNIKI